MPTYTWACTACDTSNPPQTEQCAKCGCAANASGREADLIRNGANRAPAFSLARAELTISRLSIGSIFKLWLLGLGAANLFFGVGFGIAALLGANTVRWAGEPVHGLLGLLLGLGITVLAGVVCSVVFGACSLLPLYLYSKKWPIRLTVHNVTVRQMPE